MAWSFQNTFHCLYYNVQKCLYIYIEFVFHSTALICRIENEWMGTAGYFTDFSPPVFSYKLLMLFIETDSAFTTMSRSAERPARKTDKEKRQAHHCIYIDCWQTVKVHHTPNTHKKPPWMIARLHKDEAFLFCCDRDD